MHQKKRKLFVLYSIPIWFRKRINSFSRSCLCKEKSYLVSYSIPLGCMVALLLVSLISVNPGLFLVDKSNAIEIKDEWVVSDNSPETQAAEDEEGDEVLADTDLSDISGVMPMENLAPSASITISGAGAKDEVDAILGETTYREHEINIDVKDAMSYAVMISGDSTLTPPAGGTAFTSADGASGSTMADFKWGYGWGDTTTPKEDLTYTAPTSNAKLLSSPDLNNGSVNFTKKLVFAAKFPISTIEGEYKTANGVTLSVVSTAKNNTKVWLKPDGTESNVVIGESVTHLHNISSGFCRDNSVVKTGYYIQLEDKRDGNTYTVKKLSDGNCWMMENLRLPGGLRLNKETSDVTVDTWSTPTPMTDLTKWSTTASVQQMAKGDKDMLVSTQYPGDGEGWKPAYGNYYSWCAATAGTCQSSGDAPSSICPQNWHLPPNADNASTKIYGSFTVLNGKGSAWVTKTIDDISYIGRNLGNTSENGASFFPAAGLVYSDGLRVSGTDGYYWSRTASDSSNAYRLDFHSGGVNPQNGNGARYIGYSVRCVADY